MSTMVTELYQALRQAGVEETLATAAAHAVWQPEQPATKTDIETVRREMAEMKGEIIKWNLAAMGVLTVVYTGLNAVLRFKP